MSKKKIKVLSLSKKLKIANAFECRKLHNKSDKSFPESSYYEIIKLKDSIRSKCFEEYGNIMRRRQSEFLDIENCLLEWIKQTFNKNIPKDAPLLKQKVEDFTTKLEIFYWLKGFKRRHDLVFKKATYL